ARARPRPRPRAWRSGGKRRVAYSRGSRPRPRTNRAARLHTAHVCGAHQASPEVIPDPANSYLSLWPFRRIVHAMNTHASEITIRPAYADDHEALTRLAALDSARHAPPSPLVIAEVGGELRAALSLHDGSSIADPFHP